VDLFAPGVDIYTTSAGGNYASVSGTSFSTPVTAGAVALLYSLIPTATPAQIEGYITSTLSSVGLPKGRLNVGAAVQKANLDKAASAPIILDNLAANVSDSSRIPKGKWCASTQTGSYGNASVVSCGHGTDTYRFIPNIPKAGSYAVSIRYLSKSTLTSAAPITVKSATGTIVKKVNMQLNGGQWVQLGTYNLNSGTSNYVEFADSAGAVNVDGVQFTLSP
jgi:hypothetical protein